MLLYLIRHAESEGNATNDYSTDRHDRLSAHGLAQADALVETLKTVTIDHIFVSPLLRALQTAAPYLEATARVATVWPELAEACWQQPCVDTPSAHWRREPYALPDRLAARFGFGGEAVRPVGDETYAEGLCRVHHVGKHLLRPFLHSPASVLLVSHGFFVERLMNVLLRTDTRYDHDNAAVSLLHYDGEWDLEFTNRLGSPPGHG